MNKNWLAPGYFPDFRCKADKCRHTCCRKWRIPVSREEYNRLITMECSESLNECIQNTFVMPDVVTDNHYRYISFNWLGDCRILKDGLCQLYIEKGESFLPKICCLYPRSFKNINNIKIASCSNSCEKVIEMIYENECLSIKEIELEYQAELYYEISQEDTCQIKQIQDIIRNRDISLVQSLIEICLLVNKEEFNNDFKEDIDPIKNGLNLLNKIADNNDYLKNLSDRLTIRYADSINYLNDQREFEEKYPDWMNFFERVINNSMIYEFFPFVDKRFDKTEAYKGLCCSYGLMRLTCIGATHNSNDINDLFDTISFLYHVIEHTAFYYNVSIFTNNAALMLKL